MKSIGHVSGYVKKFSHLVELEREEEMQQHEREMKSLSGRERESKGRAILHLRSKKAGTGLGGRPLLKFSRQKKGEKIPDTEISVGDLVMLSKNQPLNPNNPTGTVIEKTSYSVTVAFDETPQKFVYKSKVRMDLYVNDITFQRMLDSLSTIHKSSGRLANLMGVLLGYKKPSFSSPGELDYQDEKLNQYQKEAVKNAISANDVYLIHGPPGTGKTVSCVEVIHQSVLMGNAVIACADSNVAVDNLVEKLVDQGLNAVRVGHPARVTPTLREHTLDAMIENSPEYYRIQSLREKAFELIDERSNHRYPKMKWRRGMSNEKIKSLAEKNASSRGVSKKKIKEMAKWIKLQDKINELFEKAESIEDDLIEKILDSADVVCTTNSTAGSELLNDREFDLLVLDEATQATEPSCLIPLVRSKKIVLAGDHKQLPPTILNREAEKQGLWKSLFERLLECHGNPIRNVLRIQYRMHEDIMEFSNREFYDNKLIAHDSVRSHRLSDLNVEEKSKPIIYINTNEMQGPERSRKGSTSKENPLEAALVYDIIEDLVSKDIDKKDIGVISPYDDQVNLLSLHIPKEYQQELEIKTVDGFQGREKEVIVVSLVRSNPENEIGFLRDLRRLNVSITRARRKLILVGDSDTLSTHDTYKKLIDYVQDHGSVFDSIDDYQL